MRQTQNELTFFTQIHKSLKDES